MLGINLADMIEPWGHVVRVAIGDVRRAIEIDGAAIGALDPARVMDETIFDNER